MFFKVYFSYGDIRRSRFEEMVDLGENLPSWVQKRSESRFSCVGICFRGNFKESDKGLPLGEFSSVETTIVLIPSVFMRFVNNLALFNS